ncbi:MAG: acyltransferase [Bacteroidales bacterium]|nr:acyltransferase [Bacteroidales bacterium]
MLLIVAHHYVVNSGLLQLLQDSPWSAASSLMLVFGGWGKTGINCFLLITGYFMCKSEMSWRKLLKLYLQIVFYAVIIYTIFCITGHERLSIAGVVKLFMPVKGITNSNFVSCFLLFYLFIPFLNIFLRAIDRKQHKYLTILLLVLYSLFGGIPGIRMEFNYVSWFMALYIIAAYIRNYGFLPKVSYKSWGWIALALTVAGSASVVALEFIYKQNYTSHFLPYFLVADSNKFMSVAIAVSSFMFFKDLKIPHSRIINALGGATFGVLLIHANSDAMRRWLWQETVDCSGHFGESALLTLGYALVSVLVIFIVCAGIDWFRGRFLEPQYMRIFGNAGRGIKSSTSCKKIRNIS